MSLQVKYVDVPLGAKETASITTTSCQSFGEAQDLITGAENILWATLEPNGWALDGTREILGDSPSGVGWWSLHRSGADGRFAQIPVIRIQFPRTYTATGITFDFWAALGYWCAEVSVSWYRGQTLLQTVTGFPDGPHWILEQIVEDFDWIEIQLLATNIPQSFAKIRQIQIGQIAVFEGDELVQVSLLQEVDPSLCELSVDTLSVSIRDRKGRKLLPQRNQIMQLYEDGKLLASHCITDSSRDGKWDYNFRCQSSISKLEDTYLGGIVRSTVQEEIEKLLSDMPYYVDSRYGQMALNGYLPVCTRREALQQIAFAIGAVVTTHPDGTIELKAPQEELQWDFKDDSIFADGKCTKKAPVSQVQLTAHSYTPGEERETLLNGEIIDEESVLYLFSKPHYAYEITDGLLTGWGDNWVTITANGPVTLTALPYNYTTRVYTKTNNQAVAEAWGNTVTVKDATLVNSRNAPQILERLFAYYNLQNVLQQEVVVSGQQIGQVVRSANPWGSATQGYLIRMENNYTGSSHTAEVTIRGKEVQQI